MNEQWNQRIARNLWWLGGAAMMLSFNVIMIGCSQWLQFNRELPTVLLWGNGGLGIVTLISCLILFISLRGESPRRRGRLLAWGFVGTLFWGYFLYRSLGLVSFNVHDPITYMTDVFWVLAVGLPFLWALATFVAAALWKPQRLRRD